MLLRPGVSEGASEVQIQKRSMLNLMLFIMGPLRIPSRKVQSEAWPGTCSGPFGKHKHTVNVTEHFLCDPCF